MDDRRAGLKEQTSSLVLISDEVFVAANEEAFSWDPPAASDKGGPRDKEPRGALWI